MSTAAATAIATGDMEPFKAAVSDGVSANLCEAVAGAASVSSGLGIEVGVSWSRSRPMTSGGVQRVRIGIDYVPVITEAARNFKQAAPLEDYEIEGLVVRLDRGPTAKSGDVRFFAQVEGQPRTVVVRLESAEYSEAVQAHDQRIPVTCIGDLIKEGRHLRLINPRHFQLRTAPLVD
jgi:hypothetical protein